MPLNQTFIIVSWYKSGCKGEGWPAFDSNAFKWCVLVLCYSRMGVQLHLTPNSNLSPLTSHSIRKNKQDSLCMWPLSRYTIWTSYVRTSILIMVNWNYISILPKSLWNFVPLYVTPLSLYYALSKISIIFLSHSYFLSYSNVFNMVKKAVLKVRTLRKQYKMCWMSISVAVYADSHPSW